MKENLQLGKGKELNKRHDKFQTRLDKKVYKYMCMYMQAYKLGIKFHLKNILVKIGTSI